MLQTYLPYAAAVLVLMLSPALSYGQTLCSGPLRPTCIDMDFTYEDESGVMRCQEDLNSFIEESHAYADCLRTVIRETRDQISTATSAFRKRSGDGSADKKGSASPAQ